MPLSATVRLLKKSCQVNGNDLRNATDAGIADNEQAQHQTVVAACRYDQTQMSLGRKAANIVASFTLICCVKQNLCLTWPVLCIRHSRVALPC